MVIHVGINDLKKYSIGESIENYENILKKIKHKRVIVVSVLPVSNKFIQNNSDYSLERLSHFNQEIKFLAENIQLAISICISIFLIKMDI
jgi:type II secretory pathway component PulC